MFTVRVCNDIALLVWEAIEEEDEKGYNTESSEDGDQSRPLYEGVCHDDRVHQRGTNVNVPVISHGQHDGGLNDKEVVDAEDLEEAAIEEKENVVGIKPKDAEGFWHGGRTQKEVLY